MLPQLSITLGPLAESTATTSNSGMAVPPMFLALGIGAIVLMTIAWFWLKSQKSGSD